MYQRGNQFDAALNDEFGRLEQAINFPQDALRLDVRGAAPAKPRAGTLAYADGVGWNPGAGAGPYVHTGAAWLPLAGSGAYTPALSAVTNVSSSTAYACQWGRTGATVWVSGKLTMDPAAAGNTVLAIALPIASALALEEQCAGTAVSTVGAALIKGDSSGDQALLQWTADDLGSNTWYFSFGYRLL